MVTLLLLSMMLPQEITEADVPEILESVVEFIVAQEQERSTFIGRTIAEQPVFLSQESASAFTWAVPGLRRIPEGGRSFSARDEVEVVTCRPVCRISGDGVVLTVDRFQRGRKDGEYFLRIHARWNHAAPADGLGEARETFIITAQPDGAWQASADLAVMH